MADDRWRTIRHVVNAIACADRDVEFFQLVRLIESIRCRAALLPPGSAARQPAGTARRLSDEALRFRAVIAAHYEPASTQPLIGTQLTGVDDPTVIQTNFMAPAGAQGALPQFYTSLILHRLRNDDLSLKDFLDLFHHRMMSYFVRAWGKYRHFINYESGSRKVGHDSRRGSESDDPFTQCVRSLVDRTPYDAPPGFDENVLLYYSAAFSDRRRSAVSLTAVLQDYLGVNVDIRQLHPRQIRLLPQHCWRLTAEHGETRTGHRLGQGLIIGTSVLVAQTSFLMRIGPLNLDEFRQHLPDGERFAPLNRLVRHYVGFEFVFEIQLMLQAEAAPLFQLHSAGRVGVRLGWETWIGGGTSRSGILDQVRFVITS